MFRTILVAIDLEHGDHNSRILSAAKELAEANGADVCLLNVVPAAPAIISQFLHENFEQLASGEAKKGLASLKSELDLKDGKVSTSIRFGTVYDEVIAAAEKIGADLIITEKQNALHIPERLVTFEGDSTYVTMKNAATDSLMTALPLVMSTASRTL